MARQKMKPRVNVWAVAAAVLLIGVLAVGFDLVPGLQLRLFPVSNAVGDTQSAQPSTSTDTKPVPAVDPLADRENQILQKEAELQSREATVKAQEASATAMVNEAQIQQAQANAVRRVAETYSAMAPFKAAPMLQALDTEQAVAILRQLDHDQVAAIMTYMDPARGAALTGLLLSTDTQKR